MSRRHRHVLRLHLVDELTAAQLKARMFPVDLVRAAYAELGKLGREAAHSLGLVLEDRRLLAS